ncbi:hypothetical protein QAD02_024389 [Eretmocerus hayati]|uniref:Uncharacterized protein n=1 Tax=Eretmocerus hayati TaxID=131215 RepID=A0ACC2Q155_9HYME|nr:hypothetical protein QAD02_024389 [Eretmocerus hayati]
MTQAFAYEIEIRLAIEHDDGKFTRGETRRRRIGHYVSAKVCECNDEEELPSADAACKWNRDTIRAEEHIREPCNLSQFFDVSNEILGHGKVLDELLFLDKQVGSISREAPR